MQMHRWSSRKPRHRPKPVPTESPNSRRRGRPRRQLRWRAPHLPRRYLLTHQRRHRRRDQRPRLHRRILPRHRQRHQRRMPHPQPHRRRRMRHHRLLRPRPRLCIRRHPLCRRRRPLPSRPPRRVRHPRQLSSNSFSRRVRPDRNHLRLARGSGPRVQVLRHRRVPAGRVRRPTVPLRTLLPQHRTLHRHRQGRELVRVPAARAPRPTARLQTPLPGPRAPRRLGRADKPRCLPPARWCGVRHLR
jgi:hypothetical protein